jgi:hypothetical protein
MKRFILVGAAITAIVVAVVGLVTYKTWFAPEGSSSVDQPLPDLGGATASDASQSGVAPTPLRSGSFVGADDFHHASGTVALYQAANGTFLLRFEDYDAREGPDVYLYLTRQAGDDSADEVEGEGMRIRVPGGEGDGRATVRGSFNVFLPEGVDALQYGGITIGCDDFNHFFGHSSLA